MEHDTVEESDSSVSSASDNEPETPATDSNVYVSIRRHVQNHEYRKKKKMSSAIFKYFVNATPSQQLAMQVEIDAELQLRWRNMNDVVKYDDMGDALLHSLDAAICGGSKYRQLIPSSPTLQKNRTVVIVVLPDKAFWVTMECVLNRFVIQDLGVYRANLSKETFADEHTVELISKRLHPLLLKAVSEFDTSVDYLTQTGYIKVIVKQLKSCARTNMSPKAAGALTNSTVNAMTRICDAACPNSTLSVSNNKKTGWRYSRTCRVTGKRIEVLRSSGKHLNAILSCLQWMKSNVADFVRDRPMRMNEESRLKFFNTLREVAFSSPLGDESDDGMRRLEGIYLSLHVVSQLKFGEGQSSQGTKKTLADLILIGLHNNQQYVSAISTSYRKSSRVHKKQSKSGPKSATQDRLDNEELSCDVHHEQTVLDVCTCNLSVTCQAQKHLRLKVKML